MKRIALLMLALSVVLFSQVSPVSVPDIAGTGVAASVALLSETLMYNRVVSSQEKTNIENYLHLRCGC